ncbi:hypothetical protein AUJ69_01880 [Candidatus Woesearchaeota archaeon CG1_02_47_18]|nr:MAG: hypothetical protein AUJ69_01880 [Candidatus Woesearchaeota archaeon CG1_02_47_18]HII29720.1 NOL1/NOP2/sun family putative RNA methylase [Candidatus Woesearchaeota archaeon]
MTTPKHIPGHIPGADKIAFKEAFEARYRALLGERYNSFVDFSLSFIRKSIRVNTLKIGVRELKHRLESKGWRLDAVPWCREGFWIEGERTDIGNLEEHSLGYFYVQEAASMIPPVVLKPEPGQVVLDMCAAPGSKATQIAAMMKNQGVVIANDYQGERLKPLGINLQRMGVSNCITTLMHGFSIKGQQIFDRVLVDAPCSGTGNIRRSLGTLKMWNPTMVRRLAGMQRLLACRGFESLKPGGLMVYSTCSVEPEEDEGVVDFLLSKYSNACLRRIRLRIRSSPAVTEFEGNAYNPDVDKCLRLWPQDNNTEGFFVVGIEKAS